MSNVKSVGHSVQCGHPNFTSNSVAYLTYHITRLSIERFVRFVESMAEEALERYLSSEDFVKATSNSSRLVGKLKSAIQRHELYETHQILRTVYFRFINSEEKVNLLENLLYEGAIYLLKSGEYVSGQDIATLFLESAAKSLQLYRNAGQAEARTDLSRSSMIHHSNNKTKDWDVSQKVANLAIFLPDTEIGRSKFLAESLKILNPKIINPSLLHETLADKFFQHKKYVNARYHFLHCASADNFREIAKLLIDYQAESANRREVDLFISQFILQFLCLHTPIDSRCPPNRLKQMSNSSGVLPSLNPTGQKTRSAIKHIAMNIFSAYTLYHPSLRQSSVPYSSLPLLNFIYFIISIIDEDRETSTFQMLCDIYKVAWSRDPYYKSYLDRIGTHYFGIFDQTKSPQGGFLNNILMSLLEGGDDDEDSNHDGNNLSSCDELD